MKDLEYRLPQQRQVNGTIPGPQSAEYDRRRTESIARALNPGLPGYVVDADGGVLVDADGNSWVDFASGIAVTSVGASNKAVVEAVRESVGHFTHTSFMVSPYAGYVEVSELLAEVTPGDHHKKTVLLNSGAEAVENAVKIARAYTRKNGVITFDNAYHGRTNLTMAMTAKNNPYKTGFGPFAGDIFRVPMSYSLRDELTGEEAAMRTIHTIETQLGAENLACMIIEPIQGEGGFIVPAKGFLPTLVEWCHDNNVVFIADEIQSGFCRTGQWFGCDDENVVPDLVTTAKGIAGGLPLSAVTGCAELMDAPVVGGLGGTYGGNPVACAAAIAAIGEMKRLDLAGRAREIEAIIREELADVEKLDLIAEIRGRGAMIAIEFVDNDGKPNGATTKKIAERCKEQGVLILTCGTDGNVIRLLPSLVLPEGLLRDGLRVLTAAIKEEA